MMKQFTEKLNLFDYPIEIDINESGEVCLGDTFRPLLINNDPENFFYVWFTVGELKFRATYNQMKSALLENSEPIPAEQLENFLRKHKILPATAQERAAIKAEAPLTWKDLKANDDARKAQEAASKES